MCEVVVSYSGFSFCVLFVDECVCVCDFVMSLLCVAMAGGGGGCDNQYGIVCAVCMWRFGFSMSLVAPSFAMCFDFL